MDITITPRPLRGEITVIPSKSQAHRLLICAAFADRPTTILCPETSRDMDATAGCLRSLGAVIQQTSAGYTVSPVSQLPKTAVLNCVESGSTLRFLLPVAGALGVETTFRLEGRLPQRPLSPLWEEMERMGCSLSRPTADTIRCTGMLRSGDYCIDGSVSSQYITGLLLAFPLIGRECHLNITGKLESRPYVDMTRKVLSLFSAESGSLRSPGTVCVEGDWSNGAFFLAANALGSCLSIRGLKEDSAQGDRAVSALLPLLNRREAFISAADIPDLVPVLAIAAACRHGAVFTEIRRLRLKESDRVASVIAMVEALGGKAEAAEDTLRVFGTGLSGGTVNSCNDHRIAMAAAIAATACKEPVTILGAEAVSKSYPRFWEEYARLGGSYEQHIR